MLIAWEKIFDYKSTFQFLISLSVFDLCGSFMVIAMTHLQKSGGFRFGFVFEKSRFLVFC